MSTNLLLIFIIFNILNVIIQTIKSIATIKCGKLTASIVNAIAYALYTYIIILTACELPIWLKATIVGLCNLVGVYVVKWLEEKARKDKLWEVRATVPFKWVKCVKDCLNIADIPYNYIDIEKYHIFNIYCNTQHQSRIVKNILTSYEAKYFVSESKNL